jgi:P27 family predicted phage terminase small subunit
MKRKAKPTGPTVSTADPPAWLLEEGREEWGRILPALARRGLLEADLNILAAYCQAFAHWRACEAKVEAEGRVIVLRSDKGEVRQLVANPHVTLALKYAQQMRVLGREVGASPAARTAGGLWAARTGGGLWTASDGDEGGEA